MASKRNKKKSANKNIAVLPGDLKKMLGSALSEDVEMIEEITAAEEPPEKAPKHSEMNRKRAVFIIGIIVIIMAVVGIISTVGFAGQMIDRFADNQAQKDQFARFIYPVVICDPPPFDAAVKMRAETQLTAAIWDIIIFEDQSAFERDFDFIIVPELTVEQHAVKLFGSGIKPEHKSIVTADISFYYNEETHTYRIPADPIYFSYSPEIESITRSGNRYTLLVGYLSPTPAWYAVNGHIAEKPEKYAEYVIEITGDKMRIAAITQIKATSEEQGL
ncbi:MAG: hypothetical protein LBL87_02755 [Ruminococcus sp.]|jgi:hypothetical protein|nr:hypothetical protein [Ruminococcus sp.]